MRKYYPVGSIIPPYAQGKTGVFFSTQRLYTLKRPQAAYGGRYAVIPVADTV